MKYTLTVTGTSPAELLSFLTGLTPTEETIATNTGKNNKSGKEKTAVVEKQKSANNADDTSGNSNGSSNTSDGEIAIEQIRSAVNAKAQTGKRTEIKSLLTEFGAENVTTLAVDKYPSFLERINAL